MTSTLLLVDGDPRSSQPLRRILELEGYGVVIATTGHDALRQAATGPDLILLADTLSDLSTIAACRRLRDVTGAPLFILSSRHQETEKVLGLDAGADDYVTRPYASAELLARIRAVLRRMAHLRRVGTPPVRVGRLLVDLAAHRVSADGVDIDLTQREHEVLRVLVENRGQVVTRQRLLWAVWGPDFYGDEGILDVYIHTLRKKIEPSPVQPRYVATVRGVGYRLDVPHALRIAS